MALPSSSLARQAAAKGPTLSQCLRNSTPNQRGSQKSSSPHQLLSDRWHRGTGPLEEMPEGAFRIDSLPCRFGVSLSAPSLHKTGFFMEFSLQNAGSLL